MRFYYLSISRSRNHLVVSYFDDMVSFEKFEYHLARLNEMAPWPHYHYIPTSCVKNIFGYLPDKRWIDWPQGLPFPTNINFPQW
jgi:hypothetical protein